MAFLLALLSSALWGSADFQAGRMSKKYKAFAVLGITQLIGLAFGIFLIFATGESGAVAFGNDGFFSGYFWPGVFAGVLGYIGLICLYVGLSTGRMGVVSPISSLGAVVPVLFALIGGEQLSRGRWVGVVIALAMTVNLVAGALGGILIPMTLERYKADPAVSSGVFVTTVTDVVGFFSFLGIATVWFNLA